MAASPKNILPPFQLWNNQSLASSVNSAPTNTQYLDNMSYEISWSGTPTGTFTIQGSLDYSPGAPAQTAPNAGTWVNLPMSGTIAASAAADTAIIDINQIPTPYIRLVYTATSGTGSVTAYVAGKAV